MDNSPSVMGLVVMFLDGRLPANPVCADAVAVGQS
jgi:hypothetical protein